MTLTQKLIATLSATTVIATAALAQNAAGIDGRNGYVNLPSAFAPPKDEVRFSAYFSSNDVSGRRIDFQAADWLGIGLQNSDQFNATGVAYEDASFDLRLNLLDEGQYLPAVALGIDDVFGDGARAGEYLVASKHWGDFEASAGLGWGRYAKEGRGIETQKISGDNLFAGEASVFGGLAYHVGFVPGLSLNAEYSETLTGEDLRYGATYQGRFFGLGVYGAGEDQFSLGLSLRAQPNAPLVQQNHYGAPLTVVPRARLGLDPSPAWYAGTPTAHAVGQALMPAFAAEGFDVRAVKIDAREVALEVAGNTHIQTPFIMGRLARLLAKSAPASVEDFRFIVLNANGIPTSEVIINRSQFEALQDRDDRVAASFVSTTIQGATSLQGDNVYRPDRGFDFNYGFGLGFERLRDSDDESHFVFSPNIRASADLGFGLSVNAKAAVYLNAPDPYTDPALSADYVRTDVLHYIDEAITLERLTLDYHAKFGHDLYGRVSAGYLERQYGGINVEALYAPSELPIALAISASQVQKRDPENQFAFLENSVTTHQATLYWDTGYEGVELSAGYGKFLGGDHASIFGLSKKFANGWRVDAGLKLGENFKDTDAQRDFETSLSFSIPLQWTLPSKSTRIFDIALDSNSDVDFAQGLRIANPLYDSVEGFDKADYKLRWGRFWQ